ncbi:methionyl-tRNA formyltransferase [Simiduia curdlanivorans]|uniref:Methionyl-tRNA formyltransferase n=1 Tax=Simiduia curdlanivorans TaxID=1492769 RepID=A0ABV8V2F9_9GAMM|nr:methionyl-tRNA formyltransferase [Simiduia curdlanivorans]MDN3638013.1 methionyl-tRNA formyltransferase [Simiduia curdlanivorans]
MSPLRVIFAGTPEFAAHHLEALLGSQHQVVAVFTQPDRPAGRGKKLQASPVKTLALSHNLPVHQPIHLKTPEDQALVEQYQADVMVVVAYGLLLPKAVLSLPRLGCINVHASLLPRWRGAAPIQRAIQAGDTETGVTIMQMDVGLDTGDMLAVSRCPIEPTTTAAELHDQLCAIGCPALIDTLNQLADNSVKPVPQDHNKANYAHKLSKEEAQIDWRQPADTIDRLIRAFNPFPVAFTLLGEERLRIWQAAVVSEQTSAPPGSIVSSEQYGSKSRLVIACGAGQLALTSVQLPGKKALAIADLLAGSSAKFAEGTQFISAEPADE